MTAQNLSSLAAIITSYTGPARIPARRARALAKQLQSKAPADLRPEQRAKLDQVDRISGECDDILKARERQGPAPVRDARNYVAQAWSGLSASVSAQAALPPEVSPHGEAAQGIQDALFSKGVAFTMLDAAESWAQSNRLLERVRDEGYEPALIAMGLGPVLANVRRAVELLGAATGCDGKSGAAAEPSALALVDARDRFRIAVASYARALSVDVDELDAKTMERFIGALSPIDEVRVTTSRDSEGEEEGLPAPPLPNGGPFVTT